MPPSARSLCPGTYTLSFDASSPHGLALINHSRQILSSTIHPRWRCVRGPVVGKCYKTACDVYPWCIGCVAWPGRFFPNYWTCPSAGRPLGPVIRCPRGRVTSYSGLLALRCPRGRRVGMDAVDEGFWCQKWKGGRIQRIQPAAPGPCSGTLHRPAPRFSSSSCCPPPPSP